MNNIFKAAESALVLTVAALFWILPPVFFVTALFNEPITETLLGLWMLNLMVAGLIIVFAPTE